jgi:hypothetical protein
VGLALTKKTKYVRISDEPAQRAASVLAEAADGHSIGHAKPIRHCSERLFVRPIADEYQPRVGCLRQDGRHRAQDPMVALEALKPANGHKQRTAVLFLRRRVDR